MKTELVDSRPWVNQPKNREQLIQWLRDKCSDIEEHRKDLSFLSVDRFAKALQYRAKLEAYQEVLNELEL